ncbi:MAG: RNase adapter RapZ [Paracoccaceae bacterium]|nr:RNase adapter RapZ [Paracoccaceae bacterium]
MKNSSNLNLVIVTGPSGAGRTTALDSLEDLGFEAIDNIPLSLLPLLLSGNQINHPLALGIDARNRDFSNQNLLEVLRTLNSDLKFKCNLLYLHCSDEILLRRYSETRRRHPMAPKQGAVIGIQREKKLLESLSINADNFIDTTNMSPHDLKFQIRKIFEQDFTKKPLSISVHSFSYKRGIPTSADMVIDCRFLKNPYWNNDLKELTGEQRLIQEYIKTDEKFELFMNKIIDLIDFLIPAYESEGKSYFILSFGCTGGRHRSVFITELVAETLAKKNIQVSKRHLELERMKSNAQ